MRDLTKAYCGFKGINKICTGKWGCGVFGGEW
jgi:poly(ADP-ribose) glycohydrolase